MVESASSNVGAAGGAAAGEKCETVYTFGKELGSGAYSQVYLCIHKVKLSSAGFFLGSHYFAMAIILFICSTVLSLFFFASA